MNILAIADLFLPAEVMREALLPLRPARLDVVEWHCRDRSELHERVRRVEQHGPGAEAPPEAAWRLAEEADWIVTHMCPIGEEMIHRAAHLRLIGVCRGGTETIARSAAEARGIRIYNVPGRNAVAVAEFTVGLILAERRNIARAHHAVVTGVWRKSFLNVDQPTELADKVVGLVGFGEIGQQVAQRLTAFGVHLLIHDPVQSKQPLDAWADRFVGLDQLLKESDVVSLHARRDEQEPCLIGAHELAMMKPTAYLINTARANLVDHDALIQALNDRRIGGAALDVFDDEPIDADSLLRRLDNVTLTPHLAGSTQEAFYRSPFLLVDVIRSQTSAAAS